MKTTETTKRDFACASDASRHLPWYKRVWDLYYDGFRNMTVGKSLWILIIVKLFIFFVIIKWLFFPNILKENYDNDEDRAKAVRKELTNR